jgi:hypothetical protein
MSYTQEGSLQDLYADDLVDRASRRMARAVGGELVGDVADRTPVARIPEAYGGDHDSWVEDRGGRRPGTAKRSWSATEPVEVRDGVLRVVVDSDDYPVIIWIEHDTKPHLIRPISARSLRFPDGPSFRYADYAKHPGTTGKHMMRDALAELETAWRRPAELALERIFAEEF